MRTTTYYKATRLDGTDFRTGRVLYEVGTTVSHPDSKRFGDMRPNDPGTYLSVSVEPGEVLTGGSWPCRLFEVEPIGRTVKRTDGHYPWKRGCRALRVVKEVEAHRALGPNGAEVAALIERCPSMTEDETRSLAAAWDAARGAAGGAARGAARDAAGAAAWNAVWNAVRRSAARHAAQSAALALIVRDLITPDQFDLLYGPWRSVMEVE